MANLLLSAPIRTGILLLFYLISLAVAGGIAFYYNEDMNKAKGQADAWMSPVITQEEERTMEWIRENTPEREVFVTDIFGGEHMMGETLREGTEGGDWAIVPNVVERMGEINEFYKTTDAKRAYEIAKKYSAAYVLAPNRQVFAGFEWMPVERSTLRNAQYFELVYDEGDMEIYRVK